MHHHSSLIILTLTVMTSSDYDAGPLFADRVSQRFIFLYFAGAKTRRNVEMWCPPVLSWFVNSRT